MRLVRVAGLPLGIRAQPTNHLVRVLDKFNDTPSGSNHHENNRGLICDHHCVAKEFHDPNWVNHSFKGG